MVKKSLTDTWLLFKENVVPISLIILPIATPAAIGDVIIQSQLTTDSSHFQNLLVSAFISMLVYPVYTVAVIFYIAAIVSGEKIGTSTLWRLGVKFWFPYTILSVLFGLSVMAGFMLLVVPGILLWCRWAFASFDLILNRSKPYDALRNSWAATKSYVAALLKGYLILIVIVFCPYVLLCELMEHSLGNTSISFQVFDVAFGLVYEVFSVMFTIFTFHIYIQYRAQNQVRDV